MSGQWKSYWHLKGGWTEIPLTLKLNLRKKNVALKRLSDLYIKGLSINDVSQKGVGVNQNLTFTNRGEGGNQGKDNR